MIPVAEFSVSICSTPKFICSSDGDVPRLLITENDIPLIKRLQKQDDVCEYNISLKSNL